MQHLQIPPSVYEERKERYEKRINAMLDYVTNDTVCRSRILLRYFGEKNEHNCGQCDTCISLKNKGTAEGVSTAELTTQVLHVLSGQTMTPATLAGLLSVEKEALAETLRQLLDEGQVIAVNGMLQIKK